LRILLGKPHATVQTHVERAREGEKHWHYSTWELTAVLVPAAPETSLRDIFQDIERIRKRVKLSRIVDVKELIEEADLNGFVLDASVALRWFLDHPMPPFANRVKQHLLKGARAVVPRCGILR